MHDSDDRHFFSFLYMIRFRLFLCSKKGCKV